MSMFTRISFAALHGRAAILLLLVCAARLFAEPFQNLDFEQGYSTTSDSGVPPGWSGSMPPQGQICIEAGCGLIAGPGNPFNLLPLDGEFSVALSASGGNSVGGEASLAQTGTIPLGSKSLRILVDEWTYNRFSFSTGFSRGPISASDTLAVSVNGRPVPLYLAETLDEGQFIIAGSVSRYAGQSVDLSIRTTTDALNLLSDEGASVGGLIDNVEFSNESVFEPLAGDYNENGVVDAADYSVWRDYVGADFLPNRDPTAEGPIGASDYEFWKLKFSGGLAPPVESVPEPSFLFAAIVTSLILCRTRSIPR